MDFHKGDVCRVKSLSELLRIGERFWYKEAEMIHPPEECADQPPFNIRQMRYLCGQKFTLSRVYGGQCNSVENVEHDTQRRFGGKWLIGTWMLEPYADSDECTVKIDVLFS